MMIINFLVTILDYTSFFIIFSSLMVAIWHPKISFPIHVDIIMLALAVGVAAMCINTVAGRDLYGFMHEAEVVVRLALGSLIMRFLYDYLRRVDQ